MFGNRLSATKGAFNLFRREFADVTSHRQRAEVAVRNEFARRDTQDSRMPWQVDGIGNHRGGGIGHRGSPSKHGDGVRDAEGETSSLPSAGCDASWSIAGSDAEQAREVDTIRWGGDSGNHANAEMLTVGKMKGDVAPVVDRGAAQLRGAGHDGQNLLGDRSGDSRHRRDEHVPSIRLNGRHHAPGDWAAGHRSLDACWRAKHIEFAAKLVQHFDESVGRGSVSRLPLVRFADGLDHQIDWTIVEMKPPVGQEGNLRSPRSVEGQAGQLSPPRAGTSGHGLSVSAATRFECREEITSSRGRMQSTWPPNARYSSSGRVNSIGATMAGVGT